MFLFTSILRSKPIKVLYFDGQTEMKHGNNEATTDSKRNLRTILADHNSHLREPESGQAISEAEAVLDYLKYYNFDLSNSKYDGCPSSTETKGGLINTGQ